MANRLSETAPKLIIAATASLAAVGIVYLATHHTSPSMTCVFPASPDNAVHFAAPPAPAPSTPIVVDPPRPYPAPAK